MDMKRILQALDGASTKPVEGASDMSKFLTIIDGASKKEEQLNEGASPHKVSLPVQMAMQHYQTPKAEKPVVKNSLFKKYFVETEEKILQENIDRKEKLNKKAKEIADKISEKNRKK